jgi:hypothetical protein
MQAPARQAAHFLRLPVLQPGVQIAGVLQAHRKLPAETCRAARKEGEGMSELIAAFEIISGVVVFLFVTCPVMVLFYLGWRSVRKMEKEWAKEPPRKPYWERTGK